MVALEAHETVKRRNTATRRGDLMVLPPDEAPAVVGTVLDPAPAFVLCVN